MKYEVNDLKMKYPIYPIVGFLEEFGLTINKITVHHHIYNDKVDWCQPGHEKFIVLTPRTKKFYGI